MSQRPTRILGVAITGLVLPILISGCQMSQQPPQQPTRPASPPPSAPQASPQANAAKQWPSPPPMEIDPSKQYTGTISTTLGDIGIELFASEGPKTVNNFIFLARQGFYDNVKFHRIIKGFMIQTGDPTGTGSGGPGYKFDDEPVKRAYSRGILAMANAGRNTNGSQFFIVHAADAGLPPNYTIFGQVTSGMDVVDAIASVPVGRSPSGEQSVPQQDVRIKSVTINE